MNYPVSIIGLLLLSVAAMAQPSRSLSDLPGVTIRLNTPDPVPPGVFNHFEVIDQRSDTSRIGIHTFTPTFGHPHDKQLFFARSASSEIAAWLNTWFTKPDAPYSACIILRNLWLSDASYLREELRKDPAKEIDRTHIRFKAEIYAVRDSIYLPVLRFDTLETYRRGNMYSSTTSFYDLWNRDLSSILRTMADSASRLTAEKVGAAHPLHFRDVEEYNRSRFTAPISGEESFTPGVYASFEEFRNNAPSIRDFQVKSENHIRILYIKEGSGYYYSRQAWGYCDGRSIFVMRDGVLHRAWKEGKAFYLFGAANQELIIDMDTGLAY